MHDHWKFQEATGQDINDFSPFFEDTRLLTEDSPSKILDVIIHWNNSIRTSIFFPSFTLFYNMIRLSSSLDGI